ncbi:S-layer homology domain-containing protein [Lysinibacillus sp. NPDC056959]|uniref:S-layer homology domain-containing protein n=1 Tax=Lysinibacillus sp. NPDC056959 TaxID=3345981 RepID=UPI0036379B9C
MKKWLLLSIFLGMVLSVDFKAEASRISYFDKFMKDAPFLPVNARIEKVPDYSYDYYRMQLDEDSLVTFTFDDPSKGSILVALLQDDGSENGRSFAFIRTTEDDGDENKTVQQLQLRAGLYYVRIDGPEEKPYNATYTVAPLKSPIDVEPNNKVQEANPIALNTPIKSVGTIDAFDDYYRFTLDETSKVTLRTAKFNLQSFDQSVKLLYVDIDDNKGHRYLATTTTPDFPKSDTEVLPPGTYTLKVSASTSGYNPTYQFIVKTEAIDHPETYKNSIFGTTLKAGKKIRGFLGRNDDYYFTLDHDQKVKFTITTDSKEIMSAILEKANESGEYRQIIDYQYVQQQGLYTITALLQAGNYKMEPSTRWQQQNEVNYTIQFDEVTYSDVPTTYRYYSEIMSLSAMGIIQGYPDGQFKPTNSITRRQVFTMLSRYNDLHLTPIREMIQFKDIIRFSADYTLILPFYSAGIIDGSNGKMDLSSNLTRAQLAKILVNTFDLKMKGTSTEFNDVSSKHYAYNYIQILASNGITKGSYGNFMPNEPVSREHFSLFLYRLFENMKES